MEKKKIYLKVGIMIGIILLFFVVYIVQKITILKKLVKNNENYSNSNNYHMIETQYTPEQVYIRETYKKDDEALSKRKIISLDNEPQNSITSMKSYSNGQNDEANPVFIETANSNRVDFETSPVMPQEIFNFKDHMCSITDETNDLWAMIKVGISSKISSKMCNGHECYQIEIHQGKEQDASTIYINKQTGLIVRQQYNQNVYECITDYQYEFDNVSADDVKEPVLVE